MRKRLGRRRQGVGGLVTGRRCMGLMILLTVCVVVQMLGVPAPLLDAGGSFDIGESSLLEGWSIPAVLPVWPPLSRFMLACDPQPLLRAAFFAAALFRPPLA
jgi:hypothetical protein